jgi:dienelactone hydrolase
MGWASGRRKFGRGTLATAVAVAVGLSIPAAAAATPPTSFDPLVESQNFSITSQRPELVTTPEYQSLLTTQSAANLLAATTTQATDPEREFSSDLCWNGGNGCAGDVRLYNWGPKGYGLVRPVLFTARNGATLSGHVWSTVAGPARRPGVVITNGSVQADEQMYWWAAQTLAKEGFVVLTFDPQGQGQSDTDGEGADANEGVPAQSDGRPFYDGTEDAIDFFLSTPQSPYEPVPSCSTGTSHAAKQERRVAAGLDSAYNPFWEQLDPGEIGLAGHSYGAAGVSYIGQWDPRVKAIVAWDNLGGPGPEAGSVPGSGGTGATTIGEQPCPADPADRTTVPITKPALGMSADYGLPASPNTSLPDPEAKSTESHVYSAAGVDSGEVIIRGGSHVDFSFIPLQAFGASLRGTDMAAWYTSAWFDKYLKHEPSADRRLLTNRWREDPVEGSVDPNHDANAFSFYYNSRLDIGLAGGGRFDCESLRDGCPGMSSDDGYPGEYSYLSVATTPDATVAGGAGSEGAGASLATNPANRSLGACGSRTLRLKLRRRHGVRVTRVVVFLDGHRVLARHGRSLRVVRVPRVPGDGSHRIRVDIYAGKHLLHRKRRLLRGCGSP